MTILEISLITYICVGQIASMAILSSSSKKNRPIKITLFTLLNPLGVMTAWIISYIEDKQVGTHDE